MGIASPAWGLNEPVVAALDSTCIFIHIQGARRYTARRQRLANGSIWRMPLLQADQPPPPAYYANNVRQVLAQVASLYGDIVPRTVAAFLAQHASLSEPAQRLYARLIMRKGPVFRLSKLSYAEVDNLELAVEELAAAQLLDRNTHSAADGLLGLANFADLKVWFPRVHLARQTPRAQWVSHLLSTHSDRQITQQLACNMQWVRLRQQSQLQVSLLLYFGNQHQDLSSFITQDLGLFEYEQYPLTVAQRQLRSAADVLSQLRIRCLADLTHRLDEYHEATKQGGRLAEHLAEHLAPSVARRQDQRLRDKALNRVGAWLERQRALPQALLVYQHSQAHPARERGVRLLCKLGDLVQAQQLLQQIQAAPTTAAETSFGETFQLPKPGTGGQGRCKTQRSTYISTEVSLQQVDMVATPNIEAQALASLTASGGCGWHVENALPKGLAGLCYWAMVFAPQAGMFHHGFQSGPLDLYWDDFASSRASLLDAQDAQLVSPKAIASQLLTTQEHKQGLVNGLVHWGLFDDTFLQTLLRYIPANDLWRLAQFTIRNLAAYRAGFPDLLVIYGPGNYEFVEIKGPNDTLQASQQSWLRQLQRLDLPVRVLKFRA